MKTLSFRITLAAAMVLIIGPTACKKQTVTTGTDTPVEAVFTDPQYTTTQTVSDEAQLNTLSFDALGFMVGDLGAQTFLPPGKVADYSGFQYYRDNDQTNLGHNTSFVTIIADNVLDILTDDQIALFVAGANVQIDQINEYAYKRFPLCKAFRRLADGDLPAGTTGLDADAVKAYSAELYRLDGQISYGRAKLFGQIVNSLSATQVTRFKTLVGLKGVGNWPTGLTDKLRSKGLSPDLNVAVMTYASEFYSWYTGTVTSDVYFCPERQGTYFGSFYLKDWPAMGNPNYTINEQLTATAGQQLLGMLDQQQSTEIRGLVDAQRSSLLSLVETRRAVATELRKFRTGSIADSSTVITLSGTYGQYDGDIIYRYSTAFASVYRSMTLTQKEQLKALGDGLGYISPEGAFLYSTPVAMPSIPNTDFLFK